MILLQSALIGLPGKIGALRKERDQTMNLLKVALHSSSAALSAFDNSEPNAVQFRVSVEDAQRRNSRRDRRRIPLGQPGELSLIMTEDWNDRI